MAQKLLIKLGILLLATSFVHCDSVGILSDYEQIITSSTLLWVVGTGDPKQLDNAVLGGNETVSDATNGEDVRISPVYVCRALFNGVWISGQLRKKYSECTVSLYGQVHSYPKYEILRNVDGGANLNWVPWNKFIASLPKGAVTGCQGVPVTYVARKRVESKLNVDNGKDMPKYTYLFGKFDPKEGLGKVTVVDEQGKEIASDEGEILVETEPIRYEMTAVKLNFYRKRVIKTPKFLAETHLRNGAETESINVDSVLAYNYTYRLSYGHINGILTGLNTTVRFSNGTVVDNYKWGIEFKEDRQELFEVKQLMSPGTACNVTLRGNYFEIDTPYTATLVAFYPDGTTKSRQIHGNKVEFNMLDVIPEYGPLYFLKNNSLVPTTTTTTTTTTSTTTTTTTEKYMSAEIPSNEVMQMKKKFDDENTLNDEKGENQSLLPQEGGALSLEKKDDQIKHAGAGGTSASTAIAPSILLLLFALSTGVRQRLMM